MGRIEYVHYMHKLSNKGKIPGEGVLQIMAAKCGCKTMHYARTVPKEIAIHDFDALYPPK